MAHLEGLSQLVVRQEVTSANPRSTVASLSGLHDYARLYMPASANRTVFSVGHQCSRIALMRFMRLPWLFETRLLVLAPRRVDKARAGRDMIEWIDRRAIADSALKVKRPCLKRSIPTCVRACVLRSL